VQHIEIAHFSDRHFWHGGYDKAATDALGMAVMLAGAWLTLRPVEPAPAASRVIARPEAELFRGVARSLQLAGP